jgi:hypothetical protein
MTVQPIHGEDVARVAAFLRAHMNSRVDWRASLDVPWTAEQPNHGFMLVDAEGAIVGAHLAFYATRVIDGNVERFCNLGAFCVLEEHRFHSLRLLKTLLAQEGLHFTDLSPSGSVVGLNERLGFQSLDTSTALVPNLPWPSIPGRTRITSDLTDIESRLSGTDLELFRDHALAPAARHVLLERGSDRCYVVFRKDRRKNLPLFASLLYVSDVAAFRRLAGPFARHLLVRHGLVATLAEDRVVGHRPRLAVKLPAPRPKMFRSPHLKPAQIDYFYSELVCVAW